MVMTRTHKLVLIAAVLVLFAGFTLHDKYMRQRNVYVLSDAAAAAKERTGQESTLSGADFGEKGTETGSGEVKTPVGEIIVHIEGEVSNPGVYVLSEGARVYQLVEKAGGLTPEADRRLNLAQKLQDEAFVFVPAQGEELADSTGYLRSGDQPMLVFQPAAPGNSSLVSINTADQKSLETLPGIGPVLAERIIAYRQQHGPFQQLTDLKKVTGIGDKRFDDLADSITL